VAPEKPLKHSWSTASLFYKKVSQIVTNALVGTPLPLCVSSCCRDSDLPFCDTAARGIAPDLIIIDEAAFMDEEQFLKNVLPMLTNGNRSAITISTPGDENNWYSVLMTKCPPGIVKVRNEFPLRV
jgi:hypothetical protein